MNIGKIVCLLLAFLFTFYIPVIANSDSAYVWNNTSKPINDTVQTNSNKNKKIDSSKLKLECGSAILIEQNSGQILYEHNSHEKLRPASVTKIMTILLIMEAIDNGSLEYTDKIPCSETAAAMGGSQIWLDVREELTVDEMLKAICIVSANDCTVAMAEYIEGSQEAFVNKMNEKAKQLGMKDTTFKNCHGLDEDGHLTTSYDISLMSRELLKNHPNITKYTTIWMDLLRNGKSELVNTNKLIRNYKGATGLKTGSTSLALYNLSASATRNNLSLIAVVMKGETSVKRFNDAQKLLDYGFNNYEFNELIKKDDVITNLFVEKGNITNVDLISDRDFGIIIKKGDNKEIEQNISIPEKIYAPIYQNQKIGEITYTLNNKLIGTADIISNTEVKKETLINFIGNIYKTWFCLLRD